MPSVKSCKKTAFLGSKKLGLNVLQQVLDNSINKFDYVIIVDDKYDSRNCFEDYLNYLSSVKTVTVFTVKNNTELKSILKDNNIDITLVCGYYRILDKETLNFCKDGFYGIHNSLLPKYRGGSPLVWSIINGDKELGSTLFQLTEGVDDGDVLWQWKIKNDQLSPVYVILEKLEAEILKDVSYIWDQIVAGKALAKKQNNKTATFCAQRVQEDGRINWQLEAYKINNFIRAQSIPYPGAYFIYNGMKIIVMSSDLFTKTFYCSAGQVLRIEEKRVLIGCGFNTAMYISNLVGESGNEINIENVFNSLKNRLQL